MSAKNTDIKLWLGAGLLFGLAAFCLEAGSKAQADISRLPAAMSQTVPPAIRSTSLMASMSDMRAAAADWSYIEALQYVGDVRNAKAHYKNTYDDYREILWLDPYFHFAVLEGCSILVWGNHNLVQGRELMEDAMRVDPKFSRYRLYYAAMAYTQKGVDRAAMLNFLQSEIQKPDAPEMLLREVGNIYSKYGKRDEAIRYWTQLLDRAREEQTVNLAKSQLAKLLGKTP